MESLNSETKHILSFRIQWYDLFTGNNLIIFSILENETR